MSIHSRTNGAAPHVCIDARMIDHAGIGTYIRGVVPEVLRARSDWRITLFAPTGAAVPNAWLDARTDVVRCESTIYSIGEQVELAGKLRSGCDVFWSPHYTVPLLSTTPLVVTVHDVAHLALGDMYGGWLRRSYARLMFGAVRRKASRILFVSAFTQGEFERYVGAPMCPTAVTHNGVGADWHEVRQHERVHPRRYLLFVGSVKPHKNLVGALRAFSLMADYDGDFVVIGERTSMRTIDRDAIAFADTFGARVRFTERVDDALLKQFVAGADALVFPSLYEGFGLPPLEAMAAGCPCVVSSRGSLPEVCGDAALYCNPLEPADIAKEVTRLLTDAPLRAQQIARGRARARGLAWKTTAAGAVAALDAVIGETHVKRNGTRV